MQPLSGNPAFECQKLRVFCDFFLVGRVECQKLGFFCVFGGPESVLRIVLTIRFASYGRFFERGKMSENRQKMSKTGGFWRFFRVPVMVSEGFQSGFRVVRKLCGFRRVPEWSETVWFQRSFRVVSNRVVSEGFQSGLKLCGFRGVSEWSETVWFQRGFRVV